MNDAFEANPYQANNTGNPARSWTPLFLNPRAAACLGGALLMFVAGMMAGHGMCLESPGIFSTKELDESLGVRWETEGDQETHEQIKAALKSRALAWSRRIGNWFALPLGLGLLLVALGTTIEDRWSAQADSLNSGPVRR